MSRPPQPLWHTHPHAAHCWCHRLDAWPSQEHQNEDLYEKAVQMLETYFDCEEGDDQNLAPQLAGNQYAFGQQAAQVGC